MASGRVEELIKGKKYNVLIEAGKDPKTGKRKRIKRTVNGRKGEADDLLVAILSQLKTATYIDPERITINQWMDTWLNDYKKMNLRQTTLENYQNIINTHIKTEIGEMNLQALRPEELQKLYRAKLEGGLSTRTVRYIHTIIHGALKQATKNKLILSNPAESTTPPKLVQKKVNPMTKEQMDAFLQVLDNSTYKRTQRVAPAFKVLLGTGIRKGELLGLRWRNIDLKGGTIKIEQGIVYTKKNRVSYQDPKTNESKKEIPISDYVIEALENHQLEMTFEGNFSEDKPVFCTKDGNPISPQNFDKTYHALRKRSGIPKTISPHALRHTFATRLLEENVSLKEIQELLRHTKITTTADIYTDVSSKMKKSAVNKLNDVFKNGTKMALNTEKQ